MASGSPFDGRKRAVTDKQAAFNEPIKRPAGGASNDADAVTSGSSAESDIPDTIASDALEAGAIAGGDKSVRKGERRSIIPPTVDYKKIQQERTTRTESPFFTIYKSGQGYWTRMGTMLAALLLCLLTIHFLSDKTFVTWLNWTPDVLGSDGKTVVTPGFVNNAFMVGVIGFVTVLLATVTFLPALVSVGVALGVGVAVDIFCSMGGFGKSTTGDARVAYGFMAAFVLAFAIWAFRLMNRPKHVDFLIATDSEMKKVNWSTRDELIGSTKVVIGFMILTAVFLFSVDIIFEEIFYLLGVLRSGPFGK